MMDVIRIGTRGSKLALAQAEELRCSLTATDASFATEVVIVHTSGDSTQTRPLAEIDGKGLFVKELDEALFSGAVDLVVHSMKDVPSERPKEFVLACLLPREDPRDAFISQAAPSIDALKTGAIVGTSSPRRRGLLLYRRPDLRVVELRGNVETRLTKLESCKVDATLLAVAGLKRIGREDAATRVFHPEEFLPAACQGAIGVECRENDAPLRALLATINHPETELRVRAERALLAALCGSCNSPIAALAEISEGKLVLRGQIVNPDGTGFAEFCDTGSLADADELGRHAGMALRRHASHRFFT